MINIDKEATIVSDQNHLFSLPSKIIDFPGVSVVIYVYRLSYNSCFIYFSEDIREKHNKSTHHSTFLLIS